MLQIEIQRAVSVVLNTRRTITDRVAVYGIRYQIEILRVIHREGPESICGGHLIKVEYVTMRAVELLAMLISPHQRIGRFVGVVALQPEPRRNRPRPHHEA